MSALLKSRAALDALVLALLIPIAASSLRGLTHILSCVEEVDTPSTVILGDGEPIGLSSATLVAGEEVGLCGGLEAGEGANERLLVRLGTGAHEFNGRLLIGP